jgi:tRNA(Arg) A34 adenosine deaminase TadA
MNTQFMRQAIQLAVENIKNGGGPFGAVIVKDGKVIATGVNRVTANNDPTAHAEVCAIRAACEALGAFTLEGCDIYSSCEPCPMCLGAIYWAHLDHLYYGANKHDAADAGFDDQFIYEELEQPIASRRLTTEILIPQEAQAPFQLWKEYEARTEY